jgi:branched-chain amino acid aminotransferase
MKNIFYLNGKFLKENEAKISVYDLGFLRAYAVFDFLRTYNQKPFYLDDHLKRLLNSAKLIGLKHKYNLSSLRKIVLKTLEINLRQYPKIDFNIRIYLTGGKTEDFITPSKPNLVMMITPIKKLKEKFYHYGAKLITKIDERIFPQAKTIVYTQAVKFMQEAKKKGAIEVLLISRDRKILECTTSNFFAVMNKKLFTPKNNILLGITRKVVIQLAKKLKIPVIEKDLYFSEIKKFNEAFITANNKEILPIVKINNQKIGSGKVGEITKILMTEFKELTKKW